MGTWTLKYSTGYNANTWTSREFATYTAGSSNEEVTSISAYFGVAGNGVVYGPGTETNTDWDKVTGNGNACSIRMFSGDSTATVSITATCGRSGASSSGYYPNFSQTVLYTWTFSSPIEVAANSSVTIYFEKGSGVLCNGNGRQGNVTGSAGVPKRYITYNANGGSNAPSVQECVKNTATTISSTKPTKSSSTTNNYTVTFGANGGNTVSPSSKVSTKTTSYTFKNWNTESDGSGTSYSSGGSITLTADITLWAIYDSSTTNNAITTPTATKSQTTSIRTVTFNGNGGTPTTTSLNSTATVTYSGSGWYTATSGGTKRCANGGSYTPTATENVYQQWSSNTGAFSSITLPSASRTGYDFVGWSASSFASSPDYLSGNTYTPSASTTLYAVWSNNSYTVTYNANGGNGSMTSDVAYYGVGFKTKQNTFTRPGYTFIGWNEKADGSGTVWDSTTSGTYESGIEWSWSYEYDIILYAQWAPWSYTIVYNKNGATGGTMNSTSHEYGDGSILSQIAFTHPGYNFMGWSNSENGAVICSDQGTAPSQLVTAANQTITLYAIWSQDSPWTLAQIKLYDSTNGKWWTC